MRREEGSCTRQLNRAEEKPGQKDVCGAIREPLEHCTHPRGPVRVLGQPSAGVAGMGNSTVSAATAKRGSWGGSWSGLSRSTEIGFWATSNEHEVRWSLVKSGVYDMVQRGASLIADKRRQRRAGDRMAVVVGWRLRVHTLAAAHDGLERLPQACEGDADREDLD